MGPLKATRVTFAKRMKIRARKVSVVGGCAYFDGFGAQHGPVEQNCFFYANYEEYENNDDDDPPLIIESSLIETK